MSKHWLWLCIFLLPLVGCVPTTTPAPQSRKTTIRWSKVDSALTAWMQTPPATTPVMKRVLLQWKAGKSLPKIPGLRVYSRIGNLYSIGITAQGLKTLATSPLLQFVEAPRRLQLRRNLANSSVLAVTSSLSSSNKTRVYRFKASEKGKINFRLYPHFDKDDNLVIYPYLEVCSDSSCNKVKGYDQTDLGEVVSGPKPDPAKAPISHASVTLELSKDEEVFVRVSSLDSSTLGGFVLLVSSATSTLNPTQLSGGKTPSGRPVVPLGMATGVARKAGLSGKGVLIGVIDTGIDWCLPDFADASGKSRIVALWDQNLSPQGGEKAPDVGGDGKKDNDYGVLYDQATLSAARTSCDTSKVRSIDLESHGTQVAGIAAGRGGILGDGTAPDAELLVVKYKQTDKFSFSTNLFDAVAWMLKKAQEQKKPLVLNLSLGSHDGPADGTSLLDRALVAATGPGRVMVVAAGNEGGNAVHAQGTIDKDKTISLPFSFNGNNLGEIKIYTHFDDEYELVLTDSKGNKVTAPWGKDSNGTFGSTQVFLSVGTTKRTLVMETTLGFLKLPSDPNKWTLTMRRTKSGGNGRFDAYMVFEQKSAFDALVKQNPDGSVQGSIGELASSPGAIAVGSYNLRNVFDSAGVLDYSLFSVFGTMTAGSISLFSSRGPTRDGRVKPDLTAPGLFVSSTISSSCNDDFCNNDDLKSADGKLFTSPGTSFAAPLVAGSAALILQKDPRAFVRPLFRNTSTKSPVDKDNAPNSWGAGMFSLAKALEMFDKAASLKLSIADANGKTKGAGSLSLSLQATGSGATLAEVLWDLDGDGVTDRIASAGDKIALTFNKVGKFTIKATGVSKEGKTAIASLTVEVTEKGSEPGKEPGKEPGREPTTDAGKTTPDASTDKGSTPDKTTDKGGNKGCGCSVDHGAGSHALWFVLVLLVLARRRKSSLPL